MPARGSLCPPPAARALALARCSAELAASLPRLMGAAGRAGIPHHHGAQCQQQRAGRGGQVAGQGHHPPDGPGHQRPPLGGQLRRGRLGARPPLGRPADAAHGACLGGACQRGFAHGARGALSAPATNCTRCLKKSKAGSRLSDAQPTRRSGWRSGFGQGRPVAETVVLRRSRRCTDAACQLRT